MKYIDLALVEVVGYSGLFLVEAPRFTYLKDGDQVIISDGENEKLCRVVMSITVDPESEEYKFIVTAMGAKEPLMKITKKIIYHDLEYREDES